MRIGIGVQVSSIDGARTGLPALLDLFDEFEIRATFFVSLGPDRSVGRLRRLVGAPFISDTTRDELERLAESDHEIGAAPFDPVTWEAEAAHADEAWTRRQLAPALDVYQRVFHRDACCFGANAFQMNPHLVALEDAWELRYAADVQGQTIFLPRAQRVDGDCPQIPATLPDVAHALNLRGVTEDNLHEHLFDASLKLLPTGHVWRIQAEEEGIDWLQVVENMLVMWKGSQREVGPLGKLLEPLDISHLKRHQIGWQRDSCYGHAATQSVPVD